MNGQDGAVTVMRPDPAQYRRWLRRGDLVVLMFLAVLLVSAVAAASTGSQLGIVAGIVVGAAALGLAGVALSLRTTEVRLGPGRIEHRSWWVRRTVLTADAGLVGVLAPYTAPVVSRASDLLVIRAAGGGPRIRLNGAFWSPHELDRIAAVAGVERTVEMLDVRGFEARVPGIMHVWERRWLLVTVLGGLAVAVAAVGLAALLSA